MYTDIIRLVRQSIEDAYSAGLDYLGQSEYAVRVVRQVRPDMTQSEAFKAVNAIRMS